MIDEKLGNRIRVYQRAI